MLFHFNYSLNFIRRLRRSNNKKELFITKSSVFRYLFSDTKKWILFSNILFLNLVEIGHKIT